ncbi:similar to Saccharomyces cerevisiae YLR319C BUD6 Actin- and formin-interacting protein, involved in actin cable nucleation and polarized cell growth [Maudiozyma barnettii]|uniref:Similar to Saccharomyces cerevisiae YLR319C BUD6 Actin- and formin-interacting protein, involved in actin cable nucleation and polarized cell growth n=1 Tax=Maudiozyma barnettii TaxID=61262 RepID=A0A8H2ZLB5_9SACH|nr:Bud6p [Kazachstania barnettii]CAB4255982.1 similar to Saccharomyces cerevisiae YLR319C BUD6 Actin- and formin-interacting protein, involved in actin cable nucleation and polarized cell growth [Kazachstania barnettii]CAD1784590.1 similar to Saccharomyces cerevisiae YLR319C BUD6 Actin- and formin-interacting protein, involved in actin cable nucleation and polarized cell growth [Kazachstania barnettii]
MSSSSETGDSTSRSSLSSARTSVSIETTVTKLLMSTKHLLQILTQWSKGSATGKMVSDSYVQLGNDFKLVSKFFTHAKVDISDLGDVPTQLRKVLEVTLREPASDTTLNKYLPRIREIIVNLLDKLKVKQIQLKQARQEQLITKVSLSKDTLSPGVPSSERISTPRVTETDESQSQSNINKRLSHISSNSTQKEGDNVISNNEYIEEKEKRSSTVTHGKNNSIDIDAQHKDQIVVSKVRDSTDQDALEQLKNGSNLQRRASKRYSAYHMAKLTNQSTSVAVNAAAYATSPVPSMPNMFDIDKSNSPNRIVSDQRTELLSPQSKRLSVEQNNIDGTYTVFLKLNGNTKRCVVPIINSMKNLRLLFVERFAYSPGGDSFPDIYITDPKYNVPYELDEQEIGTITDGTTLELRTKNIPLIHDDMLNELKTSMRQEIAKSQTEILKHLTNVANGESSNNVHAKDISSPPLSESKSETTTTIDTESRAPIDKTSEINDLKRQLNIIKMLYSSNKSGLDSSILDIKKKLEDFKNVSIVNESSDKKEYVEQSQAKLGEISDNLLTSVDDLQDIIEILRKDVADRGSKPTTKKLESLDNELNSANENLIKMEKYIVSEKPHWKTIWEAELDKVCEEQQFLNLQEDLLFDLKEDLKKAVETFNLIHLCCDEQEKNPSKPRVNTILPLLKPGTFNQVREQVMVAVESINPNHEERLDALEKAEKHWEREKKYKGDDEFKDELGNFVENSGLKKLGGLEEIERQRREKDEANLRANFRGQMPL